MAYSGYLVKVGNYEIPNEFILANTLKSVIHGQDLDSYTNANGVTVRNALKNKKPIVEWTVPAMSESEFRPIMDKIQEQYINATENSCNVTAFYPEDGKYHTLKCYKPDTKFTIDRVDDDQKEVYYEKVSIKFISYGGELK